MRSIQTFWVFFLFCSSVYLSVPLADEIQHQVPPVGLDDFLTKKVSVMKWHQVPPVGLVTFYASRMECWIIWMNWRLLFEGNNDSLSASAVPEEAEEYLVACLNGIIIVVIVVKLSGSREKENSFETTTKKKKNRRRRGVCTAPWRPAVGVKPRFCCFSPKKMLILFFNIYFLFFLRRICLNLNELFFSCIRS